MAGTVTAEGSGIAGPHGTVERVKLNWVSDAAGAVSGTKVAVRGKITNVVFKPGASAVQPTDLYDVTLLDDAGVDVLKGRGANLSNATATRVQPATTKHDGTTASVGDVVVRDELELQVANAGAAKEGSVWLYVTLF